MKHYFLLLSLSLILIEESWANNCEEISGKNSSEVEDIAITALILARGGSKGIPLKNISLIGNKTLLGRTLDTLHTFSRFSEIWVSTDNETIGNVARKHCAKVFKRSPEYAKDDTPSIVSVQEFVNQTFTSPYIALIQVTSPFLRERYLKQAFDIIKSGRQCVFSVTKSYKLRWTSSDGRLLPLNFDARKRPRRQDWSGELVENGMFYISSKELLNEGTFQDEDCGVVEIDKMDAIDINDEDDLKLANVLLTINA